MIKSEVIKLDLPEENDLWLIEHYSNNYQTFEDWIHGILTKLQEIDEWAVSQTEFEKMKRVIYDLINSSMVSLEFQDNSEMVSSAWAGVLLDAIISTCYNKVAYTSIRKDIELTSGSSIYNLFRNEINRRNL